jgi:hypothetical protein
MTKLMMKAQKHMNGEDTMNIGYHVAITTRRGRVREKIPHSVKRPG